MGNQLVSIEHLQDVVSLSSKLYHGLVSSDLNPKDHQNYPSCVRISRDEIFRALEKVKDSRATIVYIKLLRSVIDAYIEESTTILDRVFHAWTSVFLSRLWLLWNQKMGKKKLDDIFTELTKHSNKHDHRSKTTAQQYFSYAASGLFHRTERSLLGVPNTLGYRRQITGRRTARGTFSFAIL